MAEWNNNEDQRRHDMDNDYRKKMGRPSIEEEQKQMERDIQKMMKPPKSGYLGGAKGRIKQLEDAAGI